EQVVGEQGFRPQVQPDFTTEEGKPAPLRKLIRSCPLTKGRQVHQVRQARLAIMYRNHRPPSWSSGTARHPTTPPRRRARATAGRLAEARRGPYLCNSTAAPAPGRGPPARARSVD